MSNAWLDRYVDAWVHHADAGTTGGTDELTALLNCYASDVLYEDVPTRAVFHGHAGIREMCAAAHGWSPDLAFAVLSRQTDGTLFALETEVSGSQTADPGDAEPSGSRFVLRGVSVGRVAEDGLVSEHRDYWDLGSFMAQVGSPTHPV